MKFASLASKLHYKLLSSWKLILSFRKDDWELQDYPVVVRRQQEKTGHWGNTVRFSSPAYVARILNWTLSGSGDTAEDALRDLRSAFDKKRQTETSMPRPGTHVPIQFAKDNRIAQHSELADEFVRTVLGLEWAFITDESALWHFAMDESLEDYYKKIKSHFGVDVSDSPDGNIADILERISRKRGPQVTSSE